MDKLLSRCTTMAAGALLSLTALAQPAGQLSPEDERAYRIDLRNVPAFTPAPGAALVLPPGDFDPDTIHVLVQLDREQLALAREPGDVQRVLRELTSDERPANAQLRLQRILQNATWQGTIRRDIAERLIEGGSFAPLDDEIAAFIRWIGTVPPESKLEPALRNGRIMPWGQAPDGSFRLLVTFYPDVDADRITAFLDNVAFEHARYTDDTWSVRLARNQLDTLIAEDSVRSVVQGPREFSPLLDAARAAIEADAVQALDLTVDPPVYNGLTGKGISVAVMDTGVDTRHDDFWEHDAVDHRTVLQISHQTPEEPVDLHGTHVAGIIASNGFQSDRDNAYETPNDGSRLQWRGIAPEATLLSFADVDSGANLAVQHDAIVLAGASVTNDSHDMSACLEYEAIAESVDALIYGTASWAGSDIPPRPAVWAAGNNGSGINGNCLSWGYFSLTAAAKNTILVGSTNVDDGSLSFTSSRGPTYDGRLKPDIVAPGCTAVEPFGIKATATAPEPLNSYVRKCGTSVAAPVVTGTIALLLEEWRSAFGASGPCPVTYPGGECFPLPSTMKAVLIHGATDMADASYMPGSEDETPDLADGVRYHAGPDYATGYGLINAAASVALVAAGPGINRRIVESEILSSTVPDEYLINVPAGTTKVRVTLAWDDFPGDSTLSDIAPKLVNDLDLELDNGSGTIALPWRLPLLVPAHDAMTGDHLLEADPLTWSDIVAADKGVDDRNNVEQVEINSPAAGTWTIRVKADKLTPTFSQKYSLVSDLAIAGAAWAAAMSSELRPCVNLEWVRTGNGVQIEIPDDSACGIVPVEPVCRYLLNCSPCEGPACPPIGLNLTQIPEDIIVEVRNRGGERMAFDDSGQRRRSLAWERLQGEKYGLIFQSTDASLPPGIFNIGMSIGAEFND